MQLQLPASGTVVAQGSHGEHHVIHNLPEHYLGRPGDPVYLRHYQRNAPHDLKTQHRDPIPMTVKGEQIREHLYQYPVDELSKALAHKLYHPKFVQLYREVVEEYFRDKFGITDLSILRSEKRPIRPSAEFYEYSEPDPLYHSDGVLSTVTSPNLITPISLLTTHGANPSEQLQNDHHLTIDSTNSEEYVTGNEKVTDSIESPITKTYPDSINAQLPHFEGDTKIPYIATTTNTESPLESLESTIQTLPSEYSNETTSPLVTETTLIIEVEQAKVTELETHDQTLTLTTHSAPTTNEKRQISESDLKNGNFSAKSDSILDSLNSQENNKITKNDINKQPSALILDTKNISTNEKINHSTNEMVIKNSTDSNVTSLNNEMIKIENKNNEKISSESEKLDSRSLVNSSVGKSSISRDNFDELGHLVLTLVNNAKEQNKEEDIKKSR